MADPEIVRAHERISRLDERVAIVETKCLSCSDLVLVPMRADLHRIGVAVLDPHDGLVVKANTLASGQLLAAAAAEEVAAQLKRVADNEIRKQALADDRRTRAKQAAWIIATMLTALGVVSAVLHYWVFP